MNYSIIVIGQPLAHELPISASVSTLEANDLLPVAHPEDSTNSTSSPDLGSTEPQQIPLVSGLHYMFSSFADEQHL
jgi:hypothetical protein